MLRGSSPLRLSRAFSCNTAYSRIMSPSVLLAYVMSLAMAEKLEMFVTTDTSTPHRLRPTRQQAILTSKTSAIVLDSINVAMAMYGFAGRRSTTSLIASSRHSSRANDCRYDSIWARSVIADVYSTWAVSRVFLRTPGLDGKRPKDQTQSSA